MTLNLPTITLSQYQKCEDQFFSSLYACGYHKENLGSIICSKHYATIKHPLLEQFKRMSYPAAFDFATKYLISN